MVLDGAYRTKNTQIKKKIPISQALNLNYFAALSAFGVAGIRQGARGPAEFVSKSHESNVGTRPRVTLARLLHWKKETSWRLWLLFPQQPEKEPSQPPPPPSPVQGERAGALYKRLFLKNDITKWILKSCQGFHDGI